MRLLGYRFREAQGLRGRYDRLSASRFLNVMHLNSHTVPVSPVLHTIGTLILSFVGYGRRGTRPAVHPATGSDTSGAPEGRIEV